MDRDSGGRFYRATVRVLALTGLLFLLVTFTPCVSWYATWLERPWADYQGDVLVIVSAAQPNSGVMDISTYWRCFMGVVYYREHPYKEVVVSGQGAAQGMKDFFVLNGIPAERILVDNEATNTRENALNTAKLLTGVSGRIVLVTSDVHLFRARRAFAKAGIHVSASPVPDVLKRASDFSVRSGLFVTEIRETASIAYYWFHGWI